jgi:hypothetical protein
MSESALKKARLAAAVFGGLLIWAILSLFTGTLCWIQAVIGLPCPGCGLTRATYALFTGQVAEALVWHPLVFVALMLFPYLGVRYTVFKQKPVRSAEKYILLGICVLFIVVFIVRMVLYFPHTPPMVMHDGTVVRRIIRIVIPMQ